MTSCLRGASFICGNPRGADRGLPPESDPFIVMDDRRTNSLFENHPRVDHVQMDWRCATRNANYQTKPRICESCWNSRSGRIGGRSAVQPGAGRAKRSHGEPRERTHLAELDCDDSRSERWSAEEVASDRRNRENEPNFGRVGL